ncbi:ATP-binding protein [Actinomadura sp. B10D3]|uniref:sensor histidine kinase n=1 Tax=Actinomadura sp. B10D3 TaxID=3153557 RepID=UPI00325C72DB
MAFLGLAAVAIVVTLGSGSREARLALATLATGAIVVLLGAVHLAGKAARRGRLDNGMPPGPDDMRQRFDELALRVLRGRQELHSLAERLAAGDVPAPRAIDERATPADDPVVALAHELQKAQDDAWNTVVHSAATAAVAAGRQAEAARAQQAEAAAPAPRVEVVVNLARRMQSLTHRAIRRLDALESHVEDTDLLKGLFQVDHLITRLRRQAESLAVVGGAASRRQWSSPVGVYQVLRSAVTEIEHYNRVKLVQPFEGALDGAAVADVIHMIAELLENATRFSPPSTQVLLRAETVTAGLAIEIEDRGLGIPRELQPRLNEMLSDPDRADSTELLREGRIGLLVVAALARRHRIAVQLQSNIFGGIQAIVVIPKAVLGWPEPERDPQPAVAPAAPPVTAIPVARSSSGSLAQMPLAAPGPAPAPTDPATMADRPSAPARSSGAAPGATRPQIPGGGDAQDSHRGGISEVWNDWDDQGTALSPRERDSRSMPSRPTEASPAGPGARWTELPRRRPQANMAPELHNTPAPRQDDEANLGHSHGMMAAFMKGMRSVEENEPE